MAEVFAGTLAVCPETGTVPRSRRHRPVTPGSTEYRWRIALPPQRLLPKIAVHQFFNKLHALEIQEPGVLLLPAVERHTDLPRPREDLGILDGRLISDHIRALPSVALHHVQRV